MRIYLNGAKKKVESKIKLLWYIRNLGLFHLIYCTAHLCLIIQAYLVMNGVEITTVHG